MEEEGHKVSLNVYDLSQGMARQLSTSFLGRAIEGIWHTGVVVYGNEYYFGGGVQHALAGKTPYGTPIRVVHLGVTHVPKDVFEMYLQEISPRYSAGTYNLLSHNCNNFSNEVAQFLVGATIPDFILNLPNEIMSSPMGAVILPMIQQLETTMRSGAVPHAPQFLPPTQVQTSQPTVTAKKSVASSGYKSSTTQAEAKEGKGKVKSEDQGNVVPPAIKPSGAQESSPNNRVEGRLGDARSKVQEEISKEFAAIMATGTLRASEAAALATRRVMQRYTRTNVAKS
ncbi:hypothetical protein RHSIM_Rhsim13G0044700 [Rhododendron simsii]|uniref:PPPDE domain-containing protein n=1 Tax=Rhododendron simsii TaxID=118357 RepID=A0A834G2N2_RHOSS|nr:hypothetical protein RHSIM_Rhsim13G0044700 [Rhododendron simsii]